MEAALAAAVALQQQGDFQGAAAAYQQALQVRPQCNRTEKSQ